ncbi:MAG: hypothetical protein CMD12_00925 [Flavobacteriales bacterium]|nr:hypothetical protein [Flavobacteriales bacterium]
MFRGFYLHSRTCLQLIVVLLFANLVWTYIAYFYYLNTIEAIVSSLRLLFSATMVYFVSIRVEQNKLINFLIYIMAFNGMLIGLQVLEQVLSLNILPNLLKYGGLWGFAENHDYEIFKKGGIFPSSQSSSILSLLLASYIIYSKKSLLLFTPIILGVLFGGRTTMILLFVLLGIVSLGYVWKLMVTHRPKVRVSSKYMFLSIFYACLSLFLIFAWFGSELGTHHLFRIQQAFSAVLSLDFTGGDSEGSAFGYFRLPSTGIEALIGNGVGRYHELGGNDPFYSRWLLQSGIPSLFLLLIIYLICFFVERDRTPSSGFIVILLLIHSFKGEVITSFFFFDMYLLYLFSKCSSASMRAV